MTRAAFSRHPLTTFFLLAFAFTWVLLPAAGGSIAVSLVALCGPAAAALLTGAVSGRKHLNDLAARSLRWRVPLRWYLFALLVPLVVSALRTAIELLLVEGGPVRFQPISGLSIVVFLLVAGEEIGWRGFALPRLLERHGPWVSSTILGVLWALWHFPLFYMSVMPQYGTPFIPYIGYLIGLSILITYLALPTAGSVIVATLFHWP